MSKIDEWAPALAVVRRYGVEGATELGKRGLLEWRGPSVEVQVAPEYIVLCPGSEARCLPAVPSAPTAAITLAPAEEPLAPGQRAVLEAADEWASLPHWALSSGDGRQTLGEREAAWKAKKAALAGKLEDAVRALSESPAVIRIDSGKVAEEQRLQACRAHAIEILPMPTEAGFPYVYTTLPGQTITGTKGVDDALGQLRGVRIESVERVGPPSPGIQRIECAVKVVQTSAPNEDVVAEAPDGRCVVCGRALETGR
jgi:hypothetical protein